MGVMTTAHAPYRAAIVGTGRIGSLLERDPLRPRPHTHAGWYASNPRTTLVAGSDVDADRLAAFGEDWAVGSPHLYADYRQLLEREHPDIVSVCAYATDRVQMCLAALAAGARGLWIEKAVACAVDEAEALSRAVAAAGAAAVVDYPRRLEPRYRAVGRWVHDEAFGRLETIHVVFSGHVVHTGTHAWDLLLDWCGPWARVEASLDTPAHEAAASGDEHERSEDDQRRYAEALRDGQTDRGGRARIVFENGVEAFVTGGAKRYFVFQCDLVFARGRVRIGNDVWDVLTPADSPRYTGYRELASLDPATHMRDDDHRQSSVLGELLGAMTTGEPSVLSMDPATRALALGVAIMQAGLTGQVVTPSTLDCTLRIASI
jgi:predicted dehydrogenase